MKFRKTFSSILISIVLTLAVLFAVVAFRVSTRGSSVVESFITSLVPQSDNGLEISIGRVESTLMRSISLKDTRVRAQGLVIADIGNIDVSLNLFNAISLVLGGKVSAVDMTVSDVFIDIADDSLKALQGVIASLSTPKATSPKATGPKATATEGPTKTSKASPLQDMRISVSVRKLDSSASIGNIALALSGANATARFSKGFSLESANLNVPAVYASQIGPEMLIVRDIRLSMDKDLSAEGSIGTVEYGDMARANNLSAIGLLRDDSISFAFYLNDGLFSYSSMEALLDSSTMRLDYLFSERSVSFSLDSQRISLSSEDQDLKLVLSNTALQGLYDGQSSVSVLMAVPGIDANMANSQIALSDMSADIGLSFDRENGMGSMGQLEISKANATLGQESIVPRAELRNLVLDYSYSSQGLEARVRGKASGESTNPYIGDFSTELDVWGQSRDFRSLSSASANLQELKMASIHDSASLSLNLANSGLLKGSFSVKGDLDSSLELDLDRRNLDLKLYLSDFRPQRYSAVYENLLSGQEAITGDTYFDGSAVLSISLTEAFSDSLKALQNANMSHMEAQSAFDIFESARVSVNTALSDVAFGKGGLSGALTLDSTIDSQRIEVGNFAVSTNGLRLSYSGAIDLNQMLPDGRLSLQRASDGSELASIFFSYIKGQKVYEFLLETPLETSTKLQGSLDWENLERIVAQARLDSKFVSEQGLEFNVTINPSPLGISVTGNEVNLEMGLDNGLFSLDGRIQDLTINATEGLAINANSNISGAYNMSEGSFEASLKDLYVKVSDLLSISLGLKVTESSLHLDSLRIGRGGTEVPFDGGLDFTFSGIADLMKGNTESLKGTVDLSAKDKGYIRMSAVDDQYYLDFNFEGLGETGLDARLGILGKRGSGFYASSDLLWGEERESHVLLNALYKGKRISFYNTQGNLGSLELDDIDFNIDFSNMVLEASTSFKNEKMFKTGDLKTQQGTITLGAKVEGLTNSLLQIFAGLDYELVFDLGLSGVSLADGFAISDTQAHLVLHNGLLDIDGNLINGMFDMRENYIDLSIDPSFLFGFKAKGYVGEKLDLMINDLHFPLPVLNQILDVPIVSFEDGYLEGDILMTGTLDNPSFYGMAYCQSLGMGLFYLPDQMLSLKNVSISLLDHTISMTRSSLTGYSNLDGRYFYGDASLEIILNGLGFQSLTIDSNVDPRFPADLWLPLKFGNMDFEIRGDVTGFVQFRMENGRLYLSTDAKATNTLIDFKLPQMPQWFGKGGGAPLDLDIRIETGKNIEFYYPEKDNSFLNFTLSEGENVRLLVQDGKFSTDGGLALKTGQVYYFHNDFIIKEGSVDLSQKKYNVSNTALPFVLNLTAELTDYDANGNKVVIDLILKDATLDNINPRFSSKPTMSQNEILSMLGQSVLSSSSLDSQVSMASIASLAATAADALSRVGVIESNNSYSLSSTIRNSLGLDIFSARSNIISNVIVDALPGELAGRGDTSMLARYLDGTSLFAGKYIGNDLFLRLTLMLKADGNASLSSDVGHFLAKDLILDTEISIDWDNPMGTFTIFTHPQELSVFDILDTIGFSVTKQIQF